MGFNTLSEGNSEGIGELRSEVYACDATHIILSEDSWVICHQTLSLGCRVSVR
jgi:hypothetical protein